MGDRQGRTGEVLGSSLPSRDPSTPVRRSPLLGPGHGAVVGLSPGTVLTGSGRTFPPALEGVEQMHGDVLDDDVVAPMLLGAVVDHDVTKRAGGGDAVGSRGDQLA